MVLVGSRSPDAAAYHRDILGRIAGHGLAEQVVLAGPVTDIALDGWYRAADLYVSMSRHEGFGVPLIEAMAFGVPVVALSVGAVPDTMGGAGVLLDHADAERVATAMLRVAEDPRHAAEVLAGQVFALEQWRLSHHLPALQQALLLAGAEPPVVVGTFEHMLRRQRIEVTGEAIPALAPYQPVEIPGAVAPGPLVEIRVGDTVRSMRAMADLSVVLLRDVAASLPLKRVRRLNADADGVLVASSMAARMLVDSGVSVPIRVVGLATDLSCFVDIGNARAARPEVAGARSRVFLHMAQATGHGLAAMLTAWACAFRAHDPVQLIVLADAELYRDVASRIAAARAADPSMADIVIRADGACPDATLSDYEVADISVLPLYVSAADDVTAARALAAGLHLIVSEQGDHIAFCGGEDANMRLLSIAPEGRDLVLALREAAERSVLAWRPPAALTALDPARWGARVAEACTDILLQPARSALRVAWISSWQSKCGIAEYSRHLLQAYLRHASQGDPDVVVLCDRQMLYDVAPLQGVKAIPVFQFAATGKLAVAVTAQEPDVLVIQHQPALLPWSKLADLLEHHALARCCVVVTLHNLRHLLTEGPAVRERVTAALGRINRVLVHASRDVRLLRELGVRNTVLLPHGTTRGPHPQLPGLLQEGDAPLIGTTGFVLPQKGLAILLQAVALLRPIWPNVRLRFATALYPNPDSEAELASCRALAERLGLSECLQWHTDFLPNDQVLRLLSDCDLLVMPYAPTLESCSGAVRQAIASGVPTLVSDIGVFDDLGLAVDRLADTTPEAVAAHIDALLRDEKRRAAIQAQAQAWIAVHDWSVTAERLRGMLLGLHAEHRERLRGVGAYEADIAMAAKGGSTPSGIGQT